MRQIFSLTKTLVYIIGAWVYIKLINRPRCDHILGSNYGQSIDSNALAIAQYLRMRGESVAFVQGVETLKVEGVVNLQRGTFATAVCFLSSKSCFYTHSLSDVLPHAHKLASVLKRIRPQCIFLQHGIIGLKRTLSNGVTMERYLKSLSPTFDYMIVSTDSEAKVVCNLGVPQQKIANTGLARFDLYADARRDELSEKLVSVIFTWQPQDKLGKKLSELSQSKLAELIARHGANHLFCKHPQQATRDIDFEFSERSIDDLVRSSAVLITDDSSIAWDMFFLGKEVLFYQPSEDWLIEDPALQARKCSDTIELVEKLDAILTSPMHFPPVHLDERNDGNNCQRIIALLSEQD